MQIFYINKDSVLPKLRMELINDGRYDYLKTYTFNNAIQNADVYFSMRDCDGRLKIAKTPAKILLGDTESCEERYILQYDWRPRDVREKGEFVGRFEIVFKNDLYESGVTYNGGNLIVPIVEDLTIMIK